MNPHSGFSIQNHHLSAENQKMFSTRPFFSFLPGISTNLKVLFWRTLQQNKCMLWKPMADLDFKIFISAMGEHFFTVRGQLFNFSYFRGNITSMLKFILWITITQWFTHISSECKFGNKMENFWTCSWIIVNHRALIQYCIAVCT